MHDNTIKFVVPDDSAEEMKKILFKYSLPEKVILWEAPESI